MALGVPGAGGLSGRVGRARPAHLREAFGPRKAGRLLHAAAAAPGEARERRLAAAGGAAAPVFARRGGQGAALAKRGGDDLAAGLAAKAQAAKARAALHGRGRGPGHGAQDPFAINPLLFACFWVSVLWGCSIMNVISSL